MKVILCEDVDNLGAMGDSVNVAPGYARNFLLPRKLAVSAESTSAKQLLHEQRIIEGREAKRRKAFNEVRERLEDVRLLFIAKAGEEGKLYGSITSLHIHEKLVELGHDIDRKCIHLAEPLRSLGETKVLVRLARDIETELSVTVQAEEGETPAPDADAAEEAPAEEEALTPYDSPQTDQAPAEDEN